MPPSLLSVVNEVRTNKGQPPVEVLCPLEDVDGHVASARFAIHRARARSYLEGRKKAAPRPTCVGR